MLPGTNNTGSSTESPFIVRAVRHNLPVVMFLVLALAILVTVYLFFSPDADSLEAVADSAAIDLGGRSGDPNAQLAPIMKPVKPQPVVQRLAQSPPPTRIGLIAGHRGSDSGTECADGLTEVEINTPVVEQLVAQLRQEGLDVDSLDEFDARLDGYSASALISVHSDSCDFINDLATGYKIAGSPYTDSSQLSICLEQAYGEATALAYHPNSITPHMTDYHAFRKLASGTQALIIEIGFLNLDRQLLTNDTDKVVKGLANGIMCFLKGVP
jgi:N-acetylmuramoyl-L-alanine amidase